MTLEPDDIRYDKAIRQAIMALTDLLSLELELDIVNPETALCTDTMIGCLDAGDDMQPGHCVDCDAVLPARAVLDRYHRRRLASADLPGHSS